jgi:hypothetical protein
MLSNFNNPGCMSHCKQKTCTCFMHDDTATWFSTAIAVRMFGHEHNPELSKFYYQLMHNLIVLKTILKFTLKLALKQLQHVSV